MKKLFTRLTSLIPGHSKCEEISLSEPFRLGKARVRVPYLGTPITVTLIREQVIFQIFSEPLLDADGKYQSNRYLLSDPSRYFSEISGFIRLEQQGETFVLGNQDRQKPVGCDLPKNLDMRHLSITHDGDGLIFRKLVSDAEIEIQSLDDDRIIEAHRVRRTERLGTIREIFGGPIELLSPTVALATLQQANQILGEESYRPLDDRGKPGGLLELPDSLVPIIIGDLHAQVNNLLTLLSQNQFMEALIKQEAVLIILGDAVHSEMDEQLDEMQDSLLIMDLILRLMMRFPHQVFYIRGNHDSFSSNLTKFGIAQCLIWEAEIRKRRCEVYLEELKRFYDSLPYVVMSKDFVACHAAPIKTRFDKKMLINIYRYPGLVKELTRNRIRRRTSPAGYTRADVRHFKKTLKLSQKIPFLVSHSPMDRENPLWLEAGGIENHHIVFSANTPWIGVFTRVRDHMIPLSYHRENLLSIINGLNGSNDSVSP